MTRADLDFRLLVGPVARAEDALSRLDERIKTSPLRQGWQNRIDYLDAAAAIWNEGELIQHVDFVLHDHKMDIRTPTPELPRAREVLTARRGAASRSASDLLTYQGVKGLVGAWEEREMPVSAKIDRPSVSQSVRDLLAFADALEAEADLPAGRAVAFSKPLPNDDVDETFELWLDALRDVQTLPPTLAVAILVDQWTKLDPIPKKAWVGRLLAGVYLRRVKRTDILPPLHLGRKLFRRQTAAKGQRESLVDLLGQIESATVEGLALFSRLSVASELLQRRVADQRKGSHLQALVDLVLDRPLVTVRMIERELKISDRAALGLIDELAPTLRELTGRQSYRAWGVA